MSNSLLVITVVVNIWAQSSGLILNPEKVIELVEKQNILVLNSQNMVTINKLEKKKAFSSFFPLLKSRVSYTHLDAQPMITIPDFPEFSFPIGVQDNWLIYFSLQQPLFAGGKILQSYIMSKNREKSQDMIHNQQVKKAKLTALQLFWNYIGLEEKLLADQESLSWFKNRVEYLNISCKNGLITEQLLLSGKVGLSLTKLQVQQTRNTLIYTKEILLTHLGISLDSPVIFKASEILEEKSSVTPLSLSDLENTVHSHAKIKELNCQRSAMQAMRKIKLGTYIPSLLAFYNVSYANENPQNSDQLVGSWNIGATLDWNIFDWGKGYQDIRIVNLRLKIIEDNIKAVSQQLKQEIGNAYRQFTETSEAFNIAKKSLGNAEKALEMAEIRYQEGVITDLELLEIHKDLSLTKSNLIQAKIAREIALVTYELTIGRL